MDLLPGPEWRPTAHSAQLPWSNKEYTASRTLSTGNFRCRRQYNNNGSSADLTQVRGPRSAGYRSIRQDAGAVTDRRPHASGERPE
jgi:hypothetical protein